MGSTNTGDYTNSLASTFYSVEGNRQSIGMIIASDGNVTHGLEKGERILYSVGTDGFKRYSWEEGKLKMEKNLDIRMYIDNLSTKGHEGIVCEPNGGKKEDEKKKEDKKKMKRKKKIKRRKGSLLAILFLALCMFIGSAYYYKRQSNEKEESDEEIGAKEIKENKMEDGEERKYDLRYNHEDKWIDLELTYLGSAKYTGTDFNYEYAHNKNEYLIEGYFNFSGQDTYERWKEDSKNWFGFYDEDFEFQEKEGKEYFVAVGRKITLFQFNMGMRNLHYYSHVMTRIKVDMEAPYEENKVYFYECEAPFEYGYFAEDQSLHPWGDWEEWLKLQKMIGEEEWSSWSNLPFEAY